MNGSDNRPIALQLYSVRRELAVDMAGTLERVAAMGYDAVEPFPLGGVTFAEQRSAIQSLGLGIHSAHLPLAAGAARDDALRAADALGVTIMVSGLGPEHFATPEATSRAAEQFNEAAAAAASAGRRFAIHNHWWEFEGEGPPWRQLLRELDPAVEFELDTYWTASAGADPIAVLRELGARATLVHLKDGSTVKGDPMTALGQGTLDVAAIAAAATSAESLVVELDECATDMLEAVAESLAFLRGRPA